MILRFENGLEALIAPHEASSLVCVQTWVKVGSGAERDVEWGIVHALEHVLLRAAGEPTSRLAAMERHGGLVTGHTRRDATLFSFVVERRDVELACRAVADALLSPVMREEHWEQERQVILKELDTRGSEPGWRLREAVLAKLWAGTSFAHATLGTRQSVEALQLTDLERFHAHWYRPSNVLVALSGGIDEAVAITLLSDCFAGLSSAASADLCGIEHPPTPRFACASASSKGERLVQAAFSMPRAVGNQALIDVAALLVARLSGASLRRHPMHGQDVLLFSFRASDDTPVEERAAQLVKMCAQSAADADIEILRARARQEFVAGRERIEDATMERALSYLRWRRPDPREDYERCLRELSATRLAEFLHQLCTADGGGSTTAGRDRSRSPLAGPRLLTPGGQPVAVLPEPCCDTASIAVVLPIDTVGVDPDREGVARVMLHHWVTSDTSSGVLQRLMRLGAVIKPLWWPDSIGLTCELLSDRFPEASELFLQLAVTPGFAGEGLGSAKRKALEAHSAARPTFFDQMLHRAQHAMWARSDQSVDPDRVAETIRATRREDVLRCWESLKSTPMAIGVHGGVAPEVAQSILERTLSSRASASSSSPAPIVARRPASSLMQFRTHQGEGQYMKVLPGVPFGSDDRIALHVAGALLSGKAGRLYTRLRGCEQLAYSFTAFSKELMHFGYVTIYAAAGVERMDVVAEVVADELRKLGAHPTHDDELHAARERVVNGFHMKNQSSLSKAVMFAKYAAAHRDPGQLLRYPERVRSVSPADVVSVASRLLTPDAGVEVRVIPASHQA